MDLMDTKKRYKLILICFLIALVFFFIGKYYGVYDLPHHDFLEKPFGMAMFGLIGCGILIVMAKIVMTPLLQRDEDYYQKGDDDEDV